jgi:hypothetical protein
MTRNRHSKGFTLIELMLAMAFITALLLGIALTVVQVGVIYNKGITVTEVNQAGRALSTEFSGSVSQSSKFTKEDYYKPTTNGGRLCTGQYSYVWNYEDVIQRGGEPLTRLGGSDKPPVHLAKVRDSTQKYCEMSPSGELYKIQHISNTDAPETTELLLNGERQLGMYTFDINLPEEGNDDRSGQKLYQLSFTIGSGESRGVTTDKTQCRPPADPLSDPTYCMVQKFDLVVRAGNGVAK